MRRRPCRGPRRAPTRRVRLAILASFALIAEVAIVAVVSVALAPVRGEPMVRAAQESYVDVHGADDFFTPEIVHVQPGETVRWLMTGRNPHTVTADDKSWDSGNLDPDTEFEHTFQTPGVYRYYCVYHGAPGGRGMAGIVLVGDAQLPAGGGGTVGPGREPVPAGPTGRTIHVPADQPTIQSAVDAAAPGDLILVAAGQYHESVRVLTPYLTIRGEDRNGVILDGMDMLPNGIHVVDADGVALENMTARHFALNGFYWTGVNGYRGSWLTAYDNGNYGIYVFDSVWGRFEHDYASGSPDSGFYIGQCQPCHAVVDDVLSERNAIGFSGTNAGGDLRIVNSEWRNNLAGIGPNTLDSEGLAPQRGADIEGNWVHDNGATPVPAKEISAPLYGLGIVIGGARDNIVAGNLVVDHPTYGILATPNLDENFWETSGNTVRDNVVIRSGRADLALGAPSGGGDCFAGNSFVSSLPPLIETTVGCGTGPRVDWIGEPGATIGELIRFAQALGGEGRTTDWRTMPAAPPQSSMPNPASAPVVLAIPGVAVPGPVTVRSMAELQALAAAPSAETGGHVTPEVTVFGVPFATSPLGLVIGLYGYVFPLMLLTAWVVLALWDQLRREDLAARRRLAWMAVTLVVPFIGPVLYFVFGGSTIARSARLMLIVGGLVVYLAFAVVGFVVTAS